MNKNNLRRLVRNEVRTLFKELASVSMETAEKLAKKLDVFGKVDIEELRKGIEIEREHSSSVVNPSLETFAKIALDHLKELPDYYTRLVDMEKKNEISTTASAPGYNIPMAFDRREEKRKKKKKDDK